MLTSGVNLVLQVLHNMLEMYDNLPNSLLDHEALTDGWQAYKQVNKIFRDKVTETSS